MGFRVDNSSLKVCFYSTHKHKKDLTPSIRKIDCVKRNTYLIDKNSAALKKDESSWET